MQSFILYFFSVQSVFVLCSIKSFEIVWFRLRKFNKLLVTMGFDYGQLNGYDRCFGFKVRPVKDK